MRALARELGEDEELWGLTGLLHDLDYEETKGDFSRHGLRSAELLEGKLPQEALHAIMAHNDLTGVKPEGKLDLALRAADALSGLIVATALVMPNKKLAEVKLSTLRKKFKAKDFARGADRDRIRLCEQLGLSLERFLELGLEAMKAIASDLGL
ncbi:phosphohydrolase [Candidatus Bathyarchaeota archaeon]|nr:MAG: phosphohydrolase [Candidatus Bathyarchaeota archaeon]